MVVETSCTLCTICHQLILCAQPAAGILASGGSIVVREHRAALERLGPHSTAHVRDGTYTAPARIYNPARDCSAAAASERVHFIIVAAAWCAGCSARSVRVALLAIREQRSDGNRSALHKSVRRRRSQRKWNMLHQYQYHGNNAREGCVQMLWQGCYRHHVRRVEGVYCLDQEYIFNILFTKKKNVCTPFLLVVFRGEGIPTARASNSAGAAR